MVSAPEDMGRFLRALPLLDLEGAIVYFEGTEEAHVADYIRGFSISPLAPGRALAGEPEPDCHHVPVTPSTLEALASFLHCHSNVFVCYHCHVYRNHSSFSNGTTRVAKTPSTSPERSTTKSSSGSRRRWGRLSVRRRRPTSSRGRQWCPAPVLLRPRVGAGPQPGPSYAIPVGTPAFAFPQPATPSGTLRLGKPAAGGLNPAVRPIALADDGYLLDRKLLRLAEFRLRCGVLWHAVSLSCLPAR